MRRASPLTDPNTPGGPVTLHFDGEAIAADRRDTVASALIAAGELMTSRSAKYRRPRGAYCLLGDCGTCLVRVNGQPNVRACLTPVRDGMQVASQNSYGDLDPTALIDAVFPGGIDHHHLVVYPRLANSVMQGVARNLTGFGTLPDHDHGAPAIDASREDHAPEVLVVGAGRAGRIVATALLAAGVDVLLLDRRDLAALTAWDPAPLPAGVRASVGVFAAYPHEGLWAAAAAICEDGAAPSLHIIRPRHVVLAIGSHQPTLPLPGNDIPGVVSARGLRHLLARTGRRPHGPVVVIGSGTRASADAQALGATLVAPEAVRKIVGRRRVKAVDTAHGRVTARLVALAPAPAPASELAAQAGAALQWNGDGFAPACDPDGRALLRAEDHPLAGPATFDLADSQHAPAPPTPPWTLWACGAVGGASDPATLAAKLLAVIRGSEASHV